MTAILKLAVGDQVRDSHGRVGRVIRFAREHVVIETEGAELCFTDSDLKAAGIVKVSPFDAEDTIPG